MLAVDNIMIVKIINIILIILIILIIIITLEILITITAHIILGGWLLGVGNSRQIFTHPVAFSSDGLVITINILNIISIFIIINITVAIITVIYD